MGNLLTGQRESTKDTFAYTWALVPKYLADSSSQDDTRQEASAAPAPVSPTPGCLPSSTVFGFTTSILCCARGTESYRSQRAPSSPAFPRPWSKPGDLKKTHLTRRSQASEQVWGGFAPQARNQLEPKLLFIGLTKQGIIYNVSFNNQKIFTFVCWF